MAAGFFDQVLGTGQRRSDRRAEPLAEADADRVEVFGPLGLGDSSRGSRVPESRSVKMSAQAALLGPIANRHDVFVRLNLSRSAIVRVFQADQPCADEMIVFR